MLHSEKNMMHRLVLRKKKFLVHGKSVPAPDCTPPPPRSDKIKSPLYIGVHPHFLAPPAPRSVAIVEKRM